jgi:hypothetical protein
MRTPVPSRLVSLVLLGLLAPAATVLAQPRPVGEPLDLAVDGLDDANFAPALAADALGNYVVVWDRWNNQAGSQSEIVFRKYAANDRPVTPRLAEVNQFRPGFQQWPDVAMNAAGWFAATWASLDQDGSSFGVYARLYRGRQAVSAEIAVPTPVRTAGSQQFPRVGIDAAGNFAVVWEGPGTTAADLFDVWVRRFDNTGSPLGRPVRVPAVNAGSESNPDIAMNPDGSSVVVWRTWQQVGPGATIFGRRFDAAGRPLGPPFQVSTGLIPSAGTPAVAVGADGRFLVAWDSCDFSDSLSGCAVRARRYDAAGRPLGAEFRVSADGTDTNVRPAPAFNQRGDFAITWNLCESEPTGQPLNCRIATRLFERSGKPVPGMSVIDSDNGLQNATVLGFAHQFLVAWDSVQCDVGGCGTSPAGTFAQRYELP